MNSPLLYRTKSNIQSSYSIKERHENRYRNQRYHLQRNSLSVGDFLCGVWAEHFEGLPDAEIDSMLKQLKWAR